MSEHSKSCCDKQHSTLDMVWPWTWCESKEKMVLLLDLVNLSALYCMAIEDGWMDDSQDQAQHYFNIWLKLLRAIRSAYLFLCGEFKALIWLLQNHYSMVICMLKLSPSIVELPSFRGQPKSKSEFILEILVRLSCFEFFIAGF